MPELEILPGLPQAVARLRREGFLTLVVTNQPDVATGKTTQAVVDEIHDGCQPFGQGLHYQPELDRNVYVKIPVTNTKGASAMPLVHRLSKQGVQFDVPRPCIRLMSFLTEVRRQGADSAIILGPPRLSGSSRPFVEQTFLR